MDVTTRSLTFCPLAEIQFKRKKVIKTSKTNNKISVNEFEDAIGPDSWLLSTTKVPTKIMTIQLFLMKKTSKETLKELIWNVPKIYTMARWSMRPWTPFCQIQISSSLTLHIFTKIFTKLRRKKMLAHQLLLLELLPLSCTVRKIIVISGRSIQFTTIL